MTDHDTSLNRMLLHEVHDIGRDYRIRELVRVRTLAVVSHLDAERNREFIK